MRKFVFIIRYGLKLLGGTNSQFRYSQKLINSYHKGLNDNEINLLSSLALNCTFVATVVYEYKILVNQSECFSRELLTKITMLMLLEDILLDEVKVAPERINNIYLGNELNLNSGLERLFTRLINEIHKQIPSKYREQQWQLISRLHEVQLNNTDSAGKKGLWFPALAFGVNPEMRDDELLFLERFGLLMKLVDDLADLRIDKNKFRAKQKLPVKKLMLKLKHDVYNLGYAKKKAGYFINALNIQTISFKWYAMFTNLLSSKVRELSYRSIPVSLFLLTVSALFALPEMLANTSLVNYSYNEDKS